MTPPKKRTKPPFKPTDAERTSVEIMAAIGTTQIDMARCIRGGIDVKTLTKYFREEIDTAGIKANVKVGGSMFNKAIGGDVQAQKYWLGCRAGWKETTGIEHGVTDEVKALMEATGEYFPLHQKNAA